MNQLTIIRQMILVSCLSIAVWGCNSAEIEKRKKPLFEGGREFSLTPDSLSMDKNREELIKIFGEAFYDSLMKGQIQFDSSMMLERKVGPSIKVE